MSIDLTLARIQQLSTLLSPYTRPTVHIAGTNGKGSVSAITSSILRTSGISVGRFNSPHLVAVNDSIAINDQSISLGLYESTRAEIKRIDEDNAIGVSSFELLVLTALQIFERAKVDIVVLEVGMGGILDATNIVSDDYIAVSVLTAVDVDHQAFLGTTVSEIATHKAGISRRNRPFVLGPQKHPEAAQAAEEVVQKNGAEIIPHCKVVARDWEAEIDGPIPSSIDLTPASFQPPPPQPVTIYMDCFSEPVQALLPLYGEHQIDNLSIAASVISTLASHPFCHTFGFTSQITLDSVVRGIKQVKWPGRLSFHRVALPSISNPLLILADGAHNPASAATLSAYITHLFSLLPASTKTFNLTFILALSHSPPKTPEQTLSPLLPVRLPKNFEGRLHVNVAALRFTSPEGMPWVKSVSPRDIRDTVVSISVDIDDIWVAEDEQEQMETALQWAAQREGLIVIAGSLYLVADLYRLITRG